MVEVLIPEISIKAMLLPILLFLFLFCLYVLCRNEKVFRYRKALLDSIEQRNRAEIDKGIYDRWRRRYDLFDQVEYETMLYRFWRPIDSFYDVDLFEL